MPSRPLSAEKLLEREYLDLARALLTTLPAGEAEPSERPDFLVQTSFGVKGIEVTRLFVQPDNVPVEDHGPRPIRPRSVQEILTKKARRLFGYSVKGLSTWLLVVLDRRLPRCNGWFLRPLCLTPTCLRSLASPF